jgi:hypothetical protein
MTTVLHVVSAENGRVLKCNHCGKQYEVSLPIPLGMYAALGTAFVKQHRRCQRPENDPR